ncbi:TIGR04283 family arsenosugar biosynthesis glycosyltransferase [Oceanibaculum pacificum]|uniref:Glycosyltransferase 2-like domain-containing protein n=1 Tax=Oceanibaculum pacificum TaxID=580166 RepID=A0A154WH73_9PROT|nr:TIGR04283 family arsenosugar biosynthesis glycosyltransferase [Oceanibaculum pacificum]KZD12860.1 hypothetical protein AUP43_00535 [Oceanibaculum pacificum]
MSLPSLTIVIPALNAAPSLPACLTALEGGDILLVDGGSDDATPAIARQAGATVIAAPGGRGAQLAAGADAAAGEWLLFLHADTVLSPGWPSAAADLMAGAGDRAGYFRLAFDDPAFSAIADAANWRSQALGLPYGDQGLLIHKDFYRALGGYRPLPLMEDVDLVRRIGRARLVELQAVATTSATRYRRDGAMRRVCRNLCCLGLYFLGVSPRQIARLYR